MVQHKLKPDRLAENEGAGEPERHHYSVCVILGRA
jgi:hypothetical protein